MKNISIVIPVFNEEKIIKKNYSIIKKYLSSIENYNFEIVFVNDGSLDNSMNLLKEIARKDLKTKIINLSRNFGTQNAIMAGLKFTKGDAIIIMDADLQDPVEIIPEMIKKWEEGYDIVYGKRKMRKGESLFKKVTAKLYYNILNILSDTKIPQNTGEFRLADRRVIETINNMPEHNRFLRGLFSWCGFSQVAIEYIREPRSNGKSKFTFKKMMNLAKDGIFSFSVKPIGIIGKIGILSIILSFIILIYSVYGYIFDNSNVVKGWTSIMVSITFFSGVQLLSLWIISQYIQRIYEESKGRPNYIIKETVNIHERKG